MRIREYTPCDLDALREMHAAQGFGYPLPNLESPLFLSKLVLEDDGEDFDFGREVDNPNSPRAGSSRVTMAILQRLTAETYLLHDPAVGTPRRRWQSFLALHDAARSAAAARGLDDVQAFLPPPIARTFGRRLTRLGWTRDPWPCYSLRIPWCRPVPSPLPLPRGWMLEENSNARIVTTSEVGLPLIGQLNCRLARHR